MKKFIPLLVVAMIAISFVSKTEATASKDLTFQIGRESRTLLINGDPFTGSATTFWKMWKGKCNFICSQQNVLFVQSITTTTDKKLVYGSALFLKVKEENCWKCIFFIGDESIAGMGGISEVSYITDTISKVVVKYGNTSTTTHEL